MIYAFIPLRSGSKSIPLKNVKEIAGKPLAQWVIDAANSVEAINSVFISTDSDLIASRLNSANFFKRGPKTATDDAPSELALIEFAKTLNNDDIIVFIQATSPLLTSDEISRGLSMILSKEYDSIVSVVRQKRFIWSTDGTPLYDLSNRPRRQDWDGILVENGAFYISRVRDILASRCRLSGKIGIVECSEESYYEIDEPSDWAIVENLLLKTKRKRSPSSSKKFTKV